MAQDVQVRAASTEKDVDDDGAGLWERGVGCRHKASFRVVMIAGGPVRGSAPVLDVISQYRQAVILVLVLDVRLALLYIEAVARLGDGGVQLGFAASFAPNNNYKQTREWRLISILGWDTAFPHHLHRHQKQYGEQRMNNQIKTNNKKNLRSFPLFTWRCSASRSG